MKSYFNLDENIIHVNHAAVAPWPVQTVEAVKQFAEENGHRGSQRYGAWLQHEAALRDKLATLINAPSADDIALLKNTSEGLSIIAYGLAWQAGDEIIIADEEFPSNRIVWESLASQGVKVIQVNLSGSGSPEQALVDAFSDKTRLLSISAVQYASGLKMDLITLGQACQQHGVLYCVDAIQQIGALNFNSQAIQADFVVADGHKWMLGPEGLALFYCRSSLRAELKLQQYGWHMLEDLSDFNKMDNWQPASTARRFECGSPNMLCIHALAASIELLLEVGMAQVEQRVLDNVQYLIRGLSALPAAQVHSPTDRARHGGIFTFSLIGHDNAALYEWLVNKGVICALRGAGIRFSPHFHNTQAQLDQLISWITDYSQS
ncbi:MAG: aminotransferase class V-fold PLP-dependent enzyme [Gammaproteobacteria bacterium]|nr:aminotransferase class V-fold PLP-dependent enzyme [Gammaproteobacteria bacterium]